MLPPILWFGNFCGPKPSSQKLTYFAGRWPTKAFFQEKIERKEVWKAQQDVLFAKPRKKPRITSFLDVNSPKNSGKKL